MILTLNGGSSSIKYAAFSSVERLFHGQVERVAAAGDTSFDEVVRELLAQIRRGLGEAKVTGIGHRIVHGGVRLLEHQVVTVEVMEELRRVQSFDLAHLPREIALVEAFAAAFPDVPQVVCFDTAFHRDMPRVAQLLPIPREYQEAGVRRFGFHGLSYTYLMRRLAELAGAEAASGRVVLAHLGSGASMAAVRGGRAVDTTMSFTPMSGLVMGTRPGDLDPGLLLYVMRERGLSVDDMEKFVAGQCGLLGVSGTSADVRDLLAGRATDARAADAIDLFCYQAKKHLCAMVAALGGLDTLVFAGGIGEHAPEIRAGICGGLEFLGLKLDLASNARGDAVISANDGRVVVRIIPTDEEAVIAGIVGTILGVA